MFDAIASPLVKHRKDETVGKIVCPASSTNSGPPLIPFRVFQSAKRRCHGGWPVGGWRSYVAVDG